MLEYRCMKAIWVKRGKDEYIKENRKRNKRVELDKTWETSWTRRICIMILTYIVGVIYSYLVRNYNYILLS